VYHKPKLKNKGSKKNNNSIAADPILPPTQLLGPAVANAMAGRPTRRVRKLAPNKCTS